MSNWTRLASTNEQEETIAEIEKELKTNGKRIVGGTTIGKSPQTVVLDLTHHGGEIHVNAEGTIRNGKHHVYGGEKEEDEE